jgi:hypothetical protein
MADPTADATKIADAIAAARKVPLIDVAREARTCWGLVGHQRPEEECRALVEALAARGIQAVFVPTDQLPKLPPARSSRKIEIDDAGFRCFLSSGATPTIPWSAVSFVAAAIVKDVTVTTETKTEGPSKSEKLIRMSITLATGIPIPGGRTRTVQVRRENTQLQAVLDIALEKPAGRFRMMADSLDTSYLGKRRGFDSMGNFKMVVEDAAGRVANDRLNRGARMFRDKGNLSQMGYDTLADLEREERWMLARRRLG